MLLGNFVERLYKEVIIVVKAKKAKPKIKMNEIVGRCMKCKKAQTMKDPKQTTLPNGRKAVKGTCPVCGTKMFRMGAM